jgi:hypothetical protein
MRRRHFAARHFLRRHAAAITPLLPFHFRLFLLTIAAAFTFHAFIAAMLSRRRHAAISADCHLPPRQIFIFAAILMPP